VGSGAFWVISGRSQRQKSCLLYRGKQTFACLAKIHKFLAGNIETKVISVLSSASAKFCVKLISDASDTEMKKNVLHYELYGSSTGTGNKGYWRWAIFAGREKKPLLVGSFYGTFEKAKEHAAAATSRLKERIQKRKPPHSK